MIISTPTFSKRAVSKADVSKFLRFHRLKSVFEELCFRHELMWTVGLTTGSRGVPFERMNKKTTYLFEMHCCVNSPGQKSSFPSQYTFIFAGPLLPNRFLSCEPPLFLNLLTADYCDRSRLKAANVLKKGKGRN